MVEWERRTWTFSTWVAYRVPYSGGSEILSLYGGEILALALVLFSGLDFCVDRWPWPLSMLCPLSVPTPGPAFKRPETQQGDGSSPHAGPTFHML